MYFKIKNILDRINEENENIKNGFKNNYIPYKFLTEDFDNWTLLYLFQKNHFSNNKETIVWCSSKLRISDEYNPLNISLVNYSIGGGEDDYKLEINNDWIHRFRESNNKEMIINPIILEELNLHYISEKMPIATGMRERSGKKKLYFIKKKILNV